MTPACRPLARRRRALLLAGALLLPAAPAPAAPPGSPWGGNYFPNVELTRQDGKTVRFYDDLVKDRHVVVNFVYTRCTKVCGLVTANLARVQRELGDRMGRDITFVSISMDPERDTPEVLARYAEAFRAGPGWSFFTGRRADVELLRRKFGDLARVEDHAPNISVGDDAAGQWWVTTALDNPRYLAVVIGGWTDPAFTGATAVAAAGYAAAPRVAPPSRGQLLFRDKCQACHEGGGRSVGPELTGVIGRRGEAWVARWIKEPGRLLAERDPTALALLASHAGVEMPTLGLSERELADLMDFLRALERPPPPGVAAAAGAGGTR